ncbi:MAG: DNA-binding protein [Candidatus Margulisbacteria bacterium]|nr:DNA-binding protein [Candidatus Margulisiibacteriota bacterium]
MKNIVFVLLLMVYALAAPAAREYSSGQLLDLPREYDNIPALYQGEIIGDIMARGENVWFNVSDGENAIGIFAPRELAAEIQTVGKYQQIGDTVRIWGEFNRACAEHGGETDIHAVRIEKIAAGYALPQPVSKFKIVLSVILALIVLILSVLDRKIQITSRRT